MYDSAIYPSPLGALTLVGQGECLVGLWIEGQKYFGGAIQDKIAPDKRELPVLKMAMDWLDRYFSGLEPKPDELPLAPVGGQFRQEIWKLLREIPYGQTVTYGQIAREAARRLGRDSMSAQAVGGAVGHNPISIIIPCHRVVGADGSLTGYAGGIEKKRWLLQWEGVDLLHPGKER